ncbi:MAG: indolepyruvate oxidoreductase subunit beta [Dehalococcoidia bacterium]|nr:indolepyruvate oxidoreductase subunit beta [Dehalococcoidia bacterium]
MFIRNVDMLVVGVGGQGVILASDIVAEAALVAGYDVKKTDSLGMAQRGGSVVSHLRMGQRVWSPLIRQGEVDLLVAFEKLEAARWSSYLRNGAVAIVNNHALRPLSVNVGTERYPSDEEVSDIMRQRSDRVYTVNGTAKARQLGNTRTLNMFMLGCSSLLLPIEVQTWKECMTQRIPSSILQVNLTAFDQGRKEGLDGNIR